MEKFVASRHGGRRRGDYSRTTIPSSSSQRLPKLRSFQSGMSQEFSPNPRMLPIQKDSLITKMISKIKRFSKRFVLRHPVFVPIFYTTVMTVLFYHWAIYKPQENLSSYQQFLVDKVSSINKNVPKEQALNWVKLIESELEGYPWLKKYGYDLPMVMGHIMTESEFSPSLTSSAWAIGLMQIQYRTAEDSQDALDIYLGDKHHRLYDPYVNIRFGINHMSYLIAKYRNLDRALSSYWAGVAGSKRLTNPMSNEYTRNVRKHRKMFLQKE